MSAYEYLALDENGAQQRGTLEADSQRQVRQVLRDREWTPLQVDAVAEHKTRQGAASFQGIGRGMSASQLALITRQFATLIQAAMPIEEALRAVAAQQEKRRLKNMLLAIRSRVLEGFTLAQSMDAFPNHFPHMYRATIAAGEHAGYLDKVLNQLADHTEQRMQSRQKVQLALLYPVILMLACVAIVSFLLGYVVPDVIKVFVDSGQALPLVTRGLIAVSEGFQQYWPWMACAGVLLFFAVRYALAKPDVRLRWDRRLMGLPVIGRFSRALNTAQFAGTLSILTRSGVSLVDALMIAAQVVGNEAMKASVKTVARKVSEGSSLHRALEEAGYFPPLMLHMIASGEATGELEVMLDRTADNQQMELENRMAMLVGLFEPLMLVVMGGVVLVIVLAILLPILNMNTLIG
ncbi:type II secretion system inner membrane protein GspF [Kistimonas asteriae]|uniref:type II secretion system inner membrane protein GspF n=1 Tax=Kistimonas asteriae TaxID=517724 RepID=UPI001BACD14C|nr:type II secretion system inner membrane protein GspF [Kistimonas asteriae]